MIDWHGPLGPDERERIVHQRRRRHSRGSPSTPRCSGSLSDGTGSVTTSITRGSRLWLQFAADSATWQLATDHALGLQVLAGHAQLHGRRLAVHGLRTSIIRLATCCSDCGAEVATDDAGPCCPGADLAEVELHRPFAALGVARAPALGSQADLERLGLAQERAA